MLTMGFHEDLDDAARIALRDMIARLGEHCGLSAEAAYRLCSLAVDFHVTQLVNQHKGVHAMLPRWCLAARMPAAPKPDKDE
jgi:acetamidase/formamidase